MTEQYIWDGDQLVVKLGTERITQFTLSTSKGTDVRMPKLVEGQTYGLTVSGVSYTATAKKTTDEGDGPIQITRARPDDTEIPVLPPVTGKTRILLEFGPVSMEMEVNENPTTDGLVNVYVIGPANTAIALYDGDPALATTAYVRGLSLVAAVRDGVRTYYHYNAHGDVVQLTNSSGTVTKNYTYDAFGVEQDASDGDANPFRYCGEQFDTETGNYYLRARYYSPEVGRFTQEDPIMDGLNWYTYCAGNPVRFYDPSGCVIKLSSEATNEEKQQYNRAIEYLQTSKTAKKLIDELKKSEITFTIVFIDDNEDTYETTHTIYWDIDSGLILGDRKSIQSAALGLAHEMGHASQHLNGQLKGRNDEEILETEEDNVSRWETPIAKELGEYARSKYTDSYRTRTMENSTDWGYFATHPWWYYIAPWNWGKPSEYYKSENTWTPD